MKEPKVELNLKQHIIKCPCCGYEYLPAEIFFDILGKPKNIIRAVNGEIDYYAGDKACLEESFVCEKCDTQFVTKCELKFITTKDLENDFDSDFETTISKNKKEEMKTVELF